MGYTFTLTLFVSHVPTLVHLFFQIYVLFLLTVPIITMRLVAEERRLRTIEILLTAPVSEPAVVFAKYLASLSLVALMLVLSGAYAISLESSASRTGGRSTAAISASSCLAPHWSRSD